MRLSGTRAAQRFRIAAAVYFLYGILYLAGAVHLVRQGLGPRGMDTRAPSFLWFVLGAIFLVLFPWLIARGTRGGLYLAFVRVLAVVVAVRAVGLLPVALWGSPRAVELPWGGRIAIRHGTWGFVALTCVTAVVLAWAGWARPVRGREQEGKP